MDKKMLLHCNIGYHFGALLARFTPAQLADTESELSKKILKIFSMLVKCDRNKLTRQLEGSPGPAVLVEFIFMSDANPNVKEYQKHLISLLGFCILREAFGLPVLRRIVENYEPSGIKLKYLCVIAQDAWGRNALREHGGLEILLDACGERFDPQATMISKHLRHYMHDAKGLSAIVRNEAFMDKLLRMIEKYSDAHENCKGNTGKLHKVEIGLRPDAPNFIAQLNELEDKTQTSYMKRTTFSKDLRDLTAMDPPPQAGSYVPLNMWSASSPVRSPTHSSPSMSPRSQANDDQEGSMSDSSMSSASSEAAKSPYLADIELHQDSSIYDEDILVCGRKICPNLLNLISWISHNPENHKCLMRRPILEMLLKCMSRGVPSDVMKTAKACILRLVKSPTILTHFLELKMHITVIRTLLRLPCLIQRYARRCVQCDERRSAGREIIQELSLHTCTTSGWAFMEALLKKNDPVVHLFACSAGVVLVRQSSYRPQMIRRFEPLLKLMNRFTAMLNEAASITVPAESGEDALHQARIDFFASNNANFEMIIFAFSSILTYKVQQDVLKSQVERQSGDEITKEDDCDACRININDIPIERQVAFKLSDGTALATVDMDALCANSEYYRGMFENNFAERTQGIREFTLGTDDSLIIHETHYKKFLHRLAGCTAKTCAGIEDTATCISLLYLADKYLAINLLDLLIFKNGLAEKFVCGNTLADFIPILLNSSLATHAPLSKLFFLIFLRYSSMEAIYEVFNVVIAVRSVDAFIELLRAFLNECWKTLPDHPSYRVWV
uniref:BTB domain-containing protein n=1 Tax=Panagrellus redivivus TaxID=6233 RepID=A0A7E4UXJ4_PANRE